MGTGTLQIDLDAVAANWRALDAMTGGETAAVVAGILVAVSMLAVYGLFGVFAVVFFTVDLNAEGRFDKAQFVELAIGEVAQFSGGVLGGDDLHQQGNGEFGLSLGAM